jgi:hypothetical protein
MSFRTVRNPHMKKRLVTRAMADWLVCVTSAAATEAEGPDGAGI